MVQFTILSGKQSGLTRSLNRFPATVGRASTADFRIEEEGVWDRHLEISLDVPRGFVAKTSPNCLASINGQRFLEVSLKNGDILEMGRLRLQFWLTETRQQSLRPREIVTWASLGILLVTELVLIYWLQS